jgi:putative pyruvate formate lyase activating enzyme
MECHVCPHDCGVDRALQPGFCRAPAQPKIALASLHHWEEPVISGSQGSGTIFFSGCNLACVFCQNYNISQGDEGKIITIERLRAIAFELKQQGAHNINLVSPTPYSEMILAALLPIKSELAIPVVWNSNGYELASVISHLEPLVDVYLPDFKYASDDAARKYSGIRDYFPHASAAIGEMWRQKRQNRLVKAGPVELMTQGLVIRHLILPGQTEDSKQVLRWIAENLSTAVYISLMAQYTPVHYAAQHPEINRRLRRSEYDEVCEYFDELGFENGWVQELTSASSEYTPDFNLHGT